MPLIILLQPLVGEENGRVRWNRAAQGDAEAAVQVGGAAWARQYLGRSRARRKALALMRLYVQLDGVDRIHHKMEGHAGGGSADEQVGFLGLRAELAQRAGGRLETGKPHGGADHFSRERRPKPVPEAAHAVAAHHQKQHGAVGRGLGAACSRGYQRQIWLQMWLQMRQAHGRGHVDILCVLCVLRLHVGHLEAALDQLHGRQHKGRGETCKQACGGRRKHRVALEQRVRGEHLLRPQEAAKKHRAFRAGAHKRRTHTFVKPARNAFVAVDVGDGGKRGVARDAGLEPHLDRVERELH